ncbi:hypothetical protein CRG98_008381 [Punica granatum]|uniref:GTP-binding protein ERG n=1 Tax=Punica granatum TaxID=22663 RepID=A0A2I0KTM9_PUNGR|nr:hypothetical protein CRG98_008381 [Punica granatum]
MKSLRALRALTALARNPSSAAAATFSRRFYSAQPQAELSPSTSPASSDSEGYDDDAVFNSSHFPLPGGSSDIQTPPQPTWDEKYRRLADKVISEEETPQKGRLRILEEEEKNRQRMLARALLGAALEPPDYEEAEGEMVVKEEDQKSLAVGIIGSPNAGKSALTNYLVGTKVAAVSRKTNTTTHEVLGVITKGDTQICFFDTPGLMLTNSGLPHKDMKVRVESAWSTIGLFDVLIVIFDVHRHLNRPDTRVVKLIERMGAKSHPKQKRVLCMNKIDLVEKKKDLLKVAQQFKDLPAYERYFMISGLKGAGVKDLTQYLMEQAVQRPWDEDPFEMSEETMKNISLEVVREKLLNYIHQHRLVDWKELRDDSIRIEQHLITHKQSQRKILVGKNGSRIRTIGMEANEELRSIFKKEVHLILQVRVK